MEGNGRDEEFRDLDLSLVRTFVVAADHGHFGDAAAELLISQQAVSKRIVRLEQIIGELLFDRLPRGVQLSTAGHSFLPHARHVLAAADAAVDAARQSYRSVRVDTWGSCMGPLRKLAALAQRRPELDIDISSRWDLASAVGALQRHEIDLAFGRLDESMTSRPGRLGARPVLLDRIALVVSEEHPLAELDVVHPADLVELEIWCPVGESAREIVSFAREFTETFGVAVDVRRHTTGPGLLSPIDVLLKDPGRVLAWGSAWTIPRAGVASVRLDPAPSFLWSMIWRESDTNSLLRHLVSLITDVSDDEGWLTYEPEHDWIPPVDLGTYSRATSTSPM